MDNNMEAWNEAMAEEVLRNLRKRRMDGGYAASPEEARTQIISMIPEGATVSRGGSMSAIEIGLFDELESLPHISFLNPYESGIPREESLRRRREALTVDVFVSGTNAVTQDGMLVNLDGTGNRVAAMIFGPAKVILVAGMNKVVKDVDAALERIKRLSAPVNAARVKAGTPCTETGLCADCNNPKRICNAWSVIEGQSVEGRIYVQLIGENLGY